MEEEQQPLTDSTEKSTPADTAVPNCKPNTTAPLESPDTDAPAAPTATTVPATDKSAVHESSLPSGTESNKEVTAPVADSEPPSGENEPSAAALVPPADKDVLPVSELSDSSPDENADLELEELALPSSIQGLSPLAAGSNIGPEGRITIKELRQTRGRVNVYTGTYRNEEGAEIPVQVKEGPEDHAGLLREGEVLSEVQYSMLPVLYATWVDDARRYLALSPVDGPTLGESFKTGMAPGAVVSVVLQLTQVFRRLHKAGWAIPGLSPGGVVMGEPVRVAALGTAARIGQPSGAAFQISGYSAPELAYALTITGKEDVYTLGAFLYQGLSGQLLPEEGAELAGLAQAIHTPGAPQLLGAALALAEERVDLEEFYTRLLAFKRRLASTPVALRVAGGTTIGLNETRVTNEDACGYLTWCSEYEGRSVYQAVLCVVDGMGGMEAGEVASTAGLRAVLRRAAAVAADDVGSAAGSDTPDGQNPSPPLAPTPLVQLAAEAVFKAAAGRQVGATITCAVVIDGVLTLGHVGDTRAYLLRDGSLTQLTRDHSLVAAMVSSGVISKAEARHHPESNKVLRSLGGQRSLPEEFIDGLDQAYGQHSLSLRPEDMILICSDGVWGQVDDDVLTRILCESPDVESAVDEIIASALEAGAPDNASAIVAQSYVLSAR